MQRWFMLGWIVVVAMGLSLPAYGESWTLATFNAEFLNRDKVHIKFGLKFNLEDEPEDVQETWANEAYRQARFEEASQAVAKLLAELKADVLALTEVGNRSEVDVLVAALRDPRSQLSARGGVRVPRLFHQTARGGIIEIPLKRCVTCHSRP